MQYLRELASRLRYGYPIGEGYRIKQLGRDEFRIWHDGFTVDIVAELMACGEFQRHLYTSFPQHWRVPHDDVDFDELSKENIVRLAAKYFERFGKRVKIVGGGTNG